MDIQNVSKEERYPSMEAFDGFDNEIGLPSGQDVIPNTVHFIVWNPEISFMEAICILAAVVNQKPELLMIHTDQELQGKYWEILQSVKKFQQVVKVVSLSVPEEVFGQRLNSTWRLLHGSHVARLQVLLEHGGIFLETDTFLVKSLDAFRKFEMSLGWAVGDWLANQAVVAHRNARFLRRWFDSYKGNYRSDELDYNSREFPTSEILAKEPGLICRVTSGLCETYLEEFLYVENNDSWVDHYAIHLSLRNWIDPPGDYPWVGLRANLSTNTIYPVIFNETNIDWHNCTVRQMVRSVIDILFNKPLIESLPQYEIFERAR